ncbi:MAG: N-acetyltransferase, partial [Erysipelotrichia bacterium]|nr:N-acetyltransferase [Erysipelotrichia bacterium]
LYGLISLDQDRRRNFPGYLTLGYWLGKAYWGKGIVVEAGEELLRFAFEECDVKMISVSHFDFNMQSKRVIEKLGFQYEGVLRESYRLYTGEMIDEVCYSLKKEEYAHATVR